MLKRVTQQVHRLLLTQSHIAVAQVQAQQIRNTTKVSRMHGARLVKEWQNLPNFRPTLRRREKVYVVEERSDKPAGDIEVILTRDIHELGEVGDVVTVPKKIARLKLFPANAAIYVTEENLKLHEDLRKEREEEQKSKQGRTAEMTIQHLEQLTVPVPMSSERSWILNSKHVRLACRSIGLQVKESSILLPTEPVTEPGDFTFNIIVNGKDSVPVQGVIFHHLKDPGFERPYIQTWKQNVIKKVDLNKLQLEIQDD